MDDFPSAGLGAIFPAVMKTAAYRLVQRTPAHRFVALMAAVLFLFTWTGEALGAHACPHHDAVPGAPATMQGMAHAGHHPAAHAPHDVPAPEHADAHACTCQGKCPSVAGGALPTSDETALRVAPAAIRAQAAPRVERIVPTLVPFFLPYGQAPPTLG